MVNRPEYRKITVTSQPDTTGEYDVKDIRRDLELFVNNAVKSVVTEGEFYKLGTRQLLPNGQMTVDIFVHEDKASLTAKSAGQLADELTFKKSADPRYAVAFPANVDEKTARALWRDEQKQADTESVRFNRSTLMKIVGLLTAIGDITRRILSSVISFSQQTAKDMVTAHNLSLNYDKVWNYRQLEKAHNMKEGTIVEGVADVQNKFGNITSLDEKAVESLAVVMGNKVEEMIKVATSEQNPEKALGMIIDSFMEKANAGYNSVGQYVGEANARRELYAYLLKLSPQWADIFATMQEEQHNLNSIFKDKFKNFDEFTRLTVEPRNEPTPAQKGLTLIASEEWGLAKATLDEIKKALVLSLVPTLISISRWIQNNRMFMSEADKERANIRNYKLNEEFIATSQQTIKAIESSGDLTSAQKARIRVLSERIARAQKENEQTNIDYVGWSSQEIQVATEMALKQEANFENFKHAHTNPNSTLYMGDDKYLSDITEKEISETLAGYPAEAKSKREAYEAELQRRKDFNKKLEQGRSSIVSEKYAEIFSQNTEEARKKAVWADVSKNWLAPENDSLARLTAITSDNEKDRENFRTLLVMDKLFPELDLLHDDSGRELTLFGALDKAESLGLGKMGTKGKKKRLFEFTASLPKPDYVAMNKEAERLADEEIASLRLDEALESFYLWAYHNDPYFFNPKVLSKRAVTEGRRSYFDPDNDYFNLFSTLGKDFANLYKYLPAGTYDAVANFKTVESKDSSGTVTHKILVDLTENGKTIAKDIEIEKWFSEQEGIVTNSLYQVNVRSNANGVTVSEIMDN